MANYKNGNLAYKIEQKNRQSVAMNYRSNAVPDVPYELPPLPERRREEYEREKQRRQLAEREKRLAYKALYKATGIQRRTTIVTSISILMVIVSLFAFLMMRQSNIVEKNFAVTRLQNQIVTLKNKNAEEYENIISQVDLTEVEKKAYEIYGLKKPSQAQRLYINMPQIDRVIRYFPEQKNTDYEKTDENIVSFDAGQIELYMKKLRTQE